MKQSFGRMLKKYREGKLKNCNNKRIKTRKFEVIESKLVEYLRLCKVRYKQDKLGVPWLMLREKCYANE